MSLLASRNVRLEGSTLTKTSGGDNWNAGAVFNSDSGDIEYSVRLIHSRERYAMIGFAPSSINVNQDGVHGSCGHYIFICNLTLYSQGGTSGAVSGLGSALAIGQTLRLRLATSPRPSISAAIEGSSNGESVCDFKQLPFPPLDSGDYRPCILIRSPDSALEISLNTASRGPNPKRARLMLKEMWQDTSFSDCRVVCGEKALRCHRIVLATASPVWRTALESSFREGHEASINIQDAKASEVEALIQYAYTDDFDDANAAALLPLAHRYEMPDLVGRCGRLMLTQLSVTNVACTVSAINTFSEHEEVAPLWSELVGKVSSDPNLIEAAMRHVRP